MTTNSASGRQHAQWARDADAPARALALVHAHTWNERASDPTWSTGDRLYCWGVARRFYRLAMGLEPALEPLIELRAVQTDG